MKHNRALMIAALIASAAPHLLADDIPARQPVKPAPRTSERLSKAEKKRERKARQRANLAERAAART